MNFILTKILNQCTSATTVIQHVIDQGTHPGLMEFLRFMGINGIVEECIYLHGVLTIFVLVILWMPFVITGSPSSTTSKTFFVGVWLTSRAVAYACMFALIYSNQVRIERGATEPVRLSASETPALYTSFRNHQSDNGFWYTLYQRLMEAKANFFVLVAKAMYVIVFDTLLIKELTRPARIFTPTP